MSNTIVIEKIMSLSYGEFVGSMRHLTSEEIGADVTSIPLATGEVRIRYQKRTGRRLSGLLRLPDALVTLTFIDVEAGERAAFVSRFDRVFQRGGG